MSVDDPRETVQDMLVTAEMNRLESCPFCGGEAQFTRNSPNLISCVDCGVTLETKATFRCNKAWNTRQDIPRAKIEELITSLRNRYEHKIMPLGRTIISSKILVLESLLQNNE